MKATRFKIKNFLSVTLMCAVLMGFVSIRTAHAADCRTILSVIESANPYANKRMGGHLNKHIFTMQASLSNSNATTATLYKQVDDWLAIWDAYRQDTTVTAPNCLAAKVDPKVILKPIVRGHNCLTHDPLNKTQCSKLDPKDFKPVKHAFVFKKVNGKWIILSAFPKP